MRLHKRMMATAALAPLLVVAQQADRFAAVAPRMQAFVDKGEVAGVVTLIATKDRIIHLSAAGKTDLAKDRKMRTDDIFWIASMSKPITSVCIAIVADDGKLSFDDPLAKHLPEFDGLVVSQNGETVKPSRPRHSAGRDDAHQRARGDEQSRAPPDAGRNQQEAGATAAALPAGEPLGVLHSGHGRARACG